MNWRYARSIAGRFRSTLLGLCVAAAFISIVHLNFASSRILDPQTASPERVILSRVAPDLETGGINTVYGKSTDFPLVAGEVRVAPLAGFTPHKRDWGSYIKPTWISAFEKGVIGFLAIVPKEPSAVEVANSKCLQDIAALGRDVCDFVRKWLSAPPDERIFIAFTKEDFEHAKRVAASFEEAGFTVFLFLKGKDQKPWADPAMVGEVFAQARYRMVIDSANARGSLGVALERECCEPLLLPSPPSTALSRALQNAS